MKVKIVFKLNIVIKIMADEMMVKELEEVVVRFSGDSGDGMQLAGNIFSNVSATVHPVCKSHWAKPPAISQKCAEKCRRKINRASCSGVCPESSTGNRLFFASKEPDLAVRPLKPMPSSR